MTTVDPPTPRPRRLPARFHWNACSPTSRLYSMSVTNLDQIQRGRRLVVLDDDPTGTQTIADLPVLTSWSVADLQWALQQPTTGFFVLTNTRSLSETDAAERNRQVVDALTRRPKRNRCRT